MLESILHGLYTRPVPGSLRPPDSQATEGGGCTARRTRNGHNYEHGGEDYLQDVGGVVSSPLNGTALPDTKSPNDCLLICGKGEETICCNGQEKKKTVSFRLCHIKPTASGPVSAGQTVGTVVKSAGAPHVHVEFYEYDCNGNQTKRCPIPW